MLCPHLKTEAQKSSQQSSLAVRSKLKTALRQIFTRQKHSAPTAHPQDQEAAQEKQQESEAVATQFHRFLDLPVELRLNIWSEATRYKRFVILKPPSNSLATWTSSTPPPPLLSVSKDAREVALRTWQLAFRTNNVPRGVVRRLSAQAFFLVCTATAGARSVSQLPIEIVV